MEFDDEDVDELSLSALFNVLIKVVLQSNIELLVQLVLICIGKVGPQFGSRSDRIIKSRDEHISMVTYLPVRPLQIYFYLKFNLSPNFRYCHQCWNELLDNRKCMCYSLLVVISF